MTKNSATWNERIEWIHRAVGHVVSSRPPNQPVSQLIAVTSSRLGRDPALHRHVCQFLSRSLLECRLRGATLLVAKGSAIEAWATRAAELFAVPLVTLSVDSADGSADVEVRSTESSRLSRDAVLIALADRVDAVFVRRGGTIVRCLKDRIGRRRDASTRVAVSATGTCAAPELIAVGAIGWYQPRQPSDAIKAQRSTPIQPRTEQGSSLDDAWTRTDGQWLVHCTRRCDGPWPGETERQYRDSILLGESSSVQRDPLDALAKIVRSQRIVVAATATARRNPVVCFSALSLHELLQRRCFRPQLCRWDYEPFGIALRLTMAKRLGIQPVIYGEPQDRSMLSREDQYRFHPIGTTYDWREEREWRSRESVNLAEWNPGDVRVFAADCPAARLRLQGCRWPVSFVSTRLFNAQPEAPAAPRKPAPPAGR